MGSVFQDYQYEIGVFFEAFLPALQILTGLIQLLSTLQITYFVKINGLVQQDTFRAPITFSILVILYLTTLLWYTYKKSILMLTPILLLAAYPLHAFYLSLSTVSILSGLYSIMKTGKIIESIKTMLLSASVLELFCLLYWIIEHPLLGTVVLRPFALFELRIFYLAIYLAPPLLILVFYLWALKPLANIIQHKPWDSSNKLTIEHSLNPRRKRLYLALLILLGVVTAFYPYLPKVNPNGVSVGVDIPRYTLALDSIKDNPREVFSIQNGSRPVIFCTLYLFQNTLHLESVTAVRFIPAILYPLLYLSVYFFSLELFGDHKVALYSAFLTATGVQVTVAVYAHFITNILSLTLVFFSLTSFFKSLKSENRRNFILSIILLALVDLTHPWSFFQYLGSFSVASAFLYFYKRKELKSGTLRAFLLYPILGVCMDLVNRVIFSGAGGELAYTALAVSITELASFWYSSLIATQLTYGGLISNLILLLLIVIGFFYLDYISTEHVFLIALWVASSPLYFLGDQMLKSRLLLNLPLGVYASLGFVAMLRSPMFEKIKKEIWVFVMLYMLVFLFRSIANIV